MKNTYLVCFSSSSGEASYKFPNQKDAKMFISSELFNRQYTHISLYKNEFLIQVWNRRYAFYKTKKLTTPVHHSIT